jgi:hypothetical protein
MALPRSYLNCVRQRGVRLLAAGAASSAMVAQAMRVSAIGGIMIRFLMVEP